MDDGPRLCTENWFQVFYSETPLLSLGVFSLRFAVQRTAPPAGGCFSTRKHASLLWLWRLYMSASSSRELVNAPLVLSTNASLNLPIHKQRSSFFCREAHTSTANVVPRCTRAAAAGLPSTITTFLF